MVFIVHTYITYTHTTAMMTTHHVNCTKKQTGTDTVKLEHEMRVTLHVMQRTVARQHPHRTLNH